MTEVVRKFQQMLDWIFPVREEIFDPVNLAPQQLVEGPVTFGTGAQTFGYRSSLIRQNGAWVLRTSPYQAVPLLMVAVFLCFGLGAVFVGGVFALMSLALLLTFLGIPTIACRFTHEAHARHLGLRDWSTPD